MTPGGAVTWAVGAPPPTGPGVIHFVGLPTGFADESHIGVFLLLGSP
ncbi:hypothetical protein GCM10009678_26140 [Actinomadura kijaniata]